VRIWLDLPDGVGELLAGQG